MTLTKLNPLSMLPRCVATKFMAALENEVEGNNVAAESSADESSVPDGANPTMKHATSLIAAKHAAEREHTRLKPHGRQSHCIEQSQPCPCKDPCKKARPTTLCTGL